MNEIRKGLCHRRPGDYCRRGAAAARMEPRESRPRGGICISRPESARSAKGWEDCEEGPHKSCAFGTGLTKKWLSFMRERQWAHGPVP